MATRVHSLNAEQHGIRSDPIGRLTRDMLYEIERMQIRRPQYTAQLRLPNETVRPIDQRLLSRDVGPNGRGPSITSHERMNAFQHAHGSQHSSNEHVEAGPSTARLGHSEVRSESRAESSRAGWRRPEKSSKASEKEECGHDVPLEDLDDDDDDDDESDKDEGPKPDSKGKGKAKGKGIWRRMTGR
jgi:hypothetical protein